MSNKVMKAAELATERISEYLITGASPSTEEAKLEMKCIIFECMVELKVSDAYEVITDSELAELSEMMMEGGAE